MHKFFYDTRKAFSIRKLTVGVVSLCVGTALLLGVPSQEVVASTSHSSQIQFEYVLESELTAAERQLIQSSLPAELKEEATYFVVYRPSKSLLPATGDPLGSSLAMLGLAFLVLAVSATKSKKARVLTMLYVTTSGLVLPFLEVEAVQSAALAAYNQTYVLKPGEALPDGRLSIAGYDFVGYYVQDRSVKTSLPLSEIGDLSRGTQSNLLQQGTGKSDLDKVEDSASTLPDSSEATSPQTDHSLTTQTEPSTNPDKKEEGVLQPEVTPGTGVPTTPNVEAETSGTGSTTEPTENQTQSDSVAPNEESEESGSELNPDSSSTPDASQPEETTKPEPPVSPPLENEGSCPLIPDNTEGGTCEASTKLPEELDPANLDCILNPPNQCSSVEEVASETVAQLRMKMEEFRNYKTRVEGYEWHIYIDTVYKHSEAMIASGNPADIRTQLEVIQDDIDFIRDLLTELGNPKVLVETDANSGPSLKFEVMAKPVNVPNDANSSPNHKNEDTTNPVTPKPEETTPEPPNVPDTGQVPPTQPDESGTTPQPDTSGTPDSSQPEETISSGEHQPDSESTSNEGDNSESSPSGESESPAQPEETVTSEQPNATDTGEVSSTQPDESGTTPQPETSGTPADSHAEETSPSGESQPDLVSIPNEGGTTETSPTEEPVSPTQPDESGTTPQPDTSGTPDSSQPEETISSGEHQPDSASTSNEGGNSESSPSGETESPTQPEETGTSEQPNVPVTAQVSPTQPEESGTAPQPDTSGTPASSQPEETISSGEHQPDSESTPNEGGSAESSPSGEIELPTQPEETTEEVVEDENRPLLRVVKNTPHQHFITDVRSTKVVYELKDEKNAFKKAIVTLYVNDTAMERKEFRKDEVTQGTMDVRFKDLLPNVDYYIRTDLVYTDSKNVERTERLMDEVHIDFEEHHFEIKNIDEAEVWKNENGRLVRKVAIKVDPNDVQNYFIKLKSDEHKDILLPVTKIEKTSLEHVTHFKLQARFTNPEEKPQKISTYHDTVTVYLPRELREDYSTFSKLLDAMKSRPDGTFELKQDLTASEISLSDSDKSYLSHQFRGTLKGNGFTIHDLKVPLFNDLRGTVSDLNLKAVDIHLPKETKVGALAKQSDNATVSNVHAHGRVFAENKIGGLIGESYQTNMTNVSFKGEIAGLKNVDNNMIGGIAGWLGGGKIEKGYVDATISATSSNVKAGGLVGQLENANTQIISSFATGSIVTTKTKDTEVGGLVGAILKGNSQNNSIQLRDNIAAVHVVNGHKVYGRVEENLQPFSNIRTVVGKAIGENNSSESITEIDAAGADQELNRWSIRPSEKEAGRKLRQKNAFDIDYATAQFALAERKQAYENMEKLLPFFTRDVIIQYGNRLEKDDELVTKKLLDVVPLVDKVPFLDILGTSTGKNNQDLPNRDKINGLLLHFADGTVKYQYLVKKKDLSRGAVTEYLILDKNISYTPEVMANDMAYKRLLGSLMQEFNSITFDSSVVQDALGLNSYQYSKDKEWLFLRESFDTVKADWQTHLSELISNYNLVGLDSSAANDYLKSYISKNKAQLLLGLAYMNRWYNIQFGDVKAKNLMMKKADFFGRNVNSLDQLIRIGSMGAEMLKPKNNYALASQVIAKESIGSDLFDYLEGYRKAFAPKMTNNDWFKSSTKATIIETPSTIKEVLEKQKNPTKDIHHNGFYEKLAGENWKFKEMALILLAMPSKDIFILTDMANTLIGMYDNNSNVSEERFQEIAKMWAGHADYLYNILPENHKEKMFRRTITWDTKRIGNDWKALDKLTSMNYSGMKHFYLPLGYVYPNELKGAHADTRMDGIYFFNHDAITEDGARVYTHEMTHIGDDNTLLLGHGKRTGLDFEVYARGLFESITWDNQDRFGINNIYDFSKYDERNYGRRLTNKTPDRFKSTQDLQDYTKGYLDVIYTLDLLEAEAVLGLSNPQAKQNWFAQMTTGTVNTSTVNTVNKVPTTLEQLIEEGMVSRRPYDYGYNGNANAYLEVRAFDPIYGSLNNDGTSRNEYEVRKIAFELLAEYGYENGMVPYLSDQYKNTLGKREAYGRMKDSELISLISRNEYENSAAFRKAMFAKRKQHLENLKPVELITKNPLNGNGYFYEGTRTVSSVDEIRRLMREAVEYDASNNQYFSNGHDIGERSRVYSLKAAILNGYLRATDDFRQSIYKDAP